MALQPQDAYRPYVYPIASGALDAHPGDELLLVTQETAVDEAQELAEPIGVSIRSTEGLTERWTLRSGPGYLGLADLDGDGLEDVVIFDVLGYGAYAFVADTAPVIVRTRGFSGIDGRLLFTDLAPVTIASAGGFGPLHAASATGLLLYAYPVAATDRPAGMDLFISALDYASLTTMPHPDDESPGFARAYQASGRILRGSDGVEVSRTTTTGVHTRTCGATSCDESGGVPLAVAAWDREPGSGARIALTSFDESGGAVEMRDGDGATLWRKAIPDMTHLPLPHQADGRGDTDLLLIHEGLADDLTLYDGKGDVIWRTLPGEYVWWAHLGADIDGDGGGDLVVWHGGDLVAWSGRTREEIWRVDVTFEVPGEWNSGSFRYCFCGDVTGDGVDDVLLHARVWLDSDPLGSHVAAVDGRTGAQLSVSPELPIEAVVWPLHSDADGDGKHDLVVATIVGAPGDDHRYAFELVTGHTFSALWTASVALTGRTFRYYFADFIPVGADLRGGGSAALAVGVLEYGYTSFEDRISRFDTSAFSSSGLIWTSR